MCRIAGLITKETRNDAEQLVRAMTRALQHGGPDDEGIYSEGQVHLGHRRLSIIDLSKNGHQPMTDAQGGLWLVFNGEIYNFPELRAELEKEGYQFRSGTDTEVLIVAYRVWGTSAFSRFKGMFAFCLYDQPKAKVYLVRDQSGIKPLYYFLDDKQLVFSSEVRAFRYFNSNWPENKAWKSTFLAFGSIPAPFTTLQGVFSLKKGSYLELDLKSFESTEKIYNQWTFSHQVKQESDAIVQVREAMDLAVERHLISDAPIGVFLSGGIDSSLLALLAAKNTGKQLSTISINFDEASFDEAVYQNIVRKDLPGSHKAYTVTDQMFLDHIEDFFQALDQPTNDGVNSYFVSKCAHDLGLKAVLSGLGADEYFGGYSSFQRIKQLKKLKQLPTGLMAKILGGFKDSYKRFKYLSMGNVVGDYLFLRGFYPPQDIADILELSESEVMRQVSSVANHLPDFAGHEQNYAAFLNAEIYMSNQLLKDTDLMSMWHALEVRVPFLDVDLLNTVLALDPSLKYDRDRPKYMLTKTYEDILPREVVYRQKYGFTFPFEIWLKRHIERLDPLLSKNEGTQKAKQKFLQSQLHWSKFWSLAVSDRF